MLGVYDYTVVLTYVSLMVSIGGMMFAVNGHLHLGVMCLAISGLCDMFDGKIARTKKNRTEVEKRFGIQIDSLSDIVCFGVAPAVLCYCFGMRGVIGVAILMFYVLAGLIRLAWFNVMEEQRQEETAEKKELTGTIDEIKDFMFVVTDKNGTSYEFTFEEKPEGLENVSEGDTVIVKYTGTISEVDPFEGEVISVEKAQ